MYKELYTATGYHTTNIHSVQRTLYSHWLPVSQTFIIVYKELYTATGYHTTNIHNVQRTLQPLVTIPQTFIVYKELYTSTGYHITNIHSVQRTLYIHWLPYHKHS